MWQFLVDCPAAPATLGRRLTAIDDRHRRAGHPPPARTDRVRDAARGRPAEPVRVDFTLEQVDGVLRRLPSHGWTNGWFGRRDRALLVLSQQAGLPYRRLCRSRRPLTAGIHTVPLLPPNDQYGHPAPEFTPLSPHSLSRPTRSHGTGTVVTHRNDPQTPNQPGQQSAPTPAPPAPVTYSHTDWEHAVARRRRDHDHLKTLDDTLADIDRRAADLHRRTCELLADH